MNQAIEILTEIMNHKRAIMELKDRLENETGVSICAESDWLQLYRGIESLGQYETGDLKTLNDGFVYLQASITINGMKVIQLADFDEGRAVFKPAEKPEPEPEVRDYANM